MLHQIKIKLNKLSKQVQVISVKRLTKDLINKFSILNIAKQFSLGIFENIFYHLYQVKSTLNVLVVVLLLNCGNLMEFHKKVFKK